jgi:hypothetical protein
MDRTSLIYLNVWLKDTASFCYFLVKVSEQILSIINTRISIPIKEHNLLIGMPTDSCKTWSPKTTWVLSTGNSSMLLMFASE